MEDIGRGSHVLHMLVTFQGSIAESQTAQIHGESWLLHNVKSSARLVCAVL